MEHIILSHMSKHLSWNNILIDQQHGFREKFSCETQLISAVHDWAKGINLCQQTDAILLDFSKAFDSVPHERLLTKLDYYGIRGKMLSWIKAFLSNRTQNVSVNGVLSSSRPVVSGVPPPPPRVLSWDQCCSLCLSMTSCALFNQIFVYLRMTVYYIER